MWRHNAYKRRSKSAFLSNPNNYGFNQAVGTYCVLRNGYFHMPLRPVRVKNIKPMQMRAMMVSNIMYYRLGKRDPLVFHDAKYLQSVAMRLGIW